MLTKDSLKQVLGQDLSDRDKALVCLALEPLSARQLKDVRAIAMSAGWRSSKNKNLSSILRRAAGLATLTDKGWELLGPGVQYVKTIAGPLMGGSPIIKVASSLRACLARIVNPATLAFVQEAIECCEGGQLRAAVVLSWVGAVSVLQDHILNTRGLLATFNTDAVARFAGARHPFVAARNKDGLSRLQEADFLVVLENIGVISKNLKQELEGSLKLRNACGHPNTYTLGEAKVNAHVEDLILNVFSQF